MHGFPRYAPISRAMARPCGYVMGDSFLSRSLSMVSLSSRRSSLVPTRMMGVLGQWCRTSGYHWSTETLGLSLHCAISIVLCLLWMLCFELHLPLHGRSQRTPGSPVRSRLKTRPVEKTGKVLILYLHAQFNYTTG